MIMYTYEPAVYASRTAQSDPYAYLVRVRLPLPQQFGLHPPVLETETRFVQLPTLSAKTGRCADKPAPNAT